MHTQWLAMEQYRHDCVLEWPDSPYKKAVLAAIHSTLNSLTGMPPPPEGKTGCITCKRLEQKRDLAESGASRPLAA
jgi:hypothetical protein